MHNCTNIANMTAEAVSYCLNELSARIIELEAKNQKNTERLDIKDYVGYGTMAYGAIMFGFFIRGMYLGCKAAKAREEMEAQITELQKHVGIQPKKDTKEQTLENIDIEMLPQNNQRVMMLETHEIDLKIEQEYIEENKNIKKSNKVANDAEVEIDPRYKKSVGIQVSR